MQEEIRIAKRRADDNLHLSLLKRKRQSFREEMEIVKRQRVLDKQLMLAKRRKRGGTVGSKGDRSVVKVEDDSLVVLDVIDLTDD